MKTVIRIAIVMVIMCMASVSFAAGENCFSITGSAWGKHCDADPSSLELTVKNICDKKMNLNFCIEQEGGVWDCKGVQAVNEGAEATFSSCKNTGNYKLTACEDDIEDCKQK
ncbi:hypothetical protein ACFLZI_02690 [Nitrospirota bacterium]